MDRMDFARVTVPMQPDLFDSADLLAEGNYDFKPWILNSTPSSGFAIITWKQP